MTHPLVARGPAVLAAVVAVAGLGGLSGCAGGPPQAARPAAPSVATSAPLPVFRLPPASLGRRLAWQQRLQLERDGAAVATLEALLEVDAERLQLALIGAGRTLARLTWDGRQLQRDTAAGWPEAVAPERVLSDLQLALWPADALRPALPPGYRLDEDGSRRVLHRGDEAVARVEGAGSAHIELVHHRLGYRLRIDSVALPGEPDA